MRRKGGSKESKFPEEKRGIFPKRSDHEKSAFRSSVLEKSSKSQARRRGVGVPVKREKTTEKEEGRKYCSARRFGMIGLKNSLEKRDYKIRSEMTLPARADRGMRARREEGRRSERG